MVILSAIKQTLSNKKYALIFAVLVLIMIFVFILIPVKSIPGNSFSFQLEILTGQDFVFMAILAVLSALFITMRIYVTKLTKQASKTVGSGAGGFGAAFAAVIGTASCTSCLIALFGFLGIGLGGAIFILQYREYFIAGILGLLLISLYYTSRNINKTCSFCD